MSDLKALFEQATVDVKTVSSTPSNDDLLFLYAHFKQGSSGDCTGSRPGMTNFVARAKYDAWKKLAGMSREDAMQKYIDKVKALKSR